MIILNIIYIAAVVGGIILRRRLKKRAEDSFEYTADTPEGRKERFFSFKSNSTALVRALIIIVLVIVGLILGIINLLIDDYWIFFDRGRKKELSKSYGITFDTDVKPQKYIKTFGGQAGANRRLQLVISKSPEEFIADNMHCEILTYVVDNRLHYTPYYWEKYPPVDDEEKEWAATDYSWEYPLTGGKTAIYKIDSDKRRFDLSVYEYEGDSYLVEIN